MSSRWQGEEDIMAAFKRTNFDPVVRSLQQTKQALIKAEVPTDVLFYGRLASNLKKVNCCQALMSTLQLSDFKSTCRISMVLLIIVVGRVRGC